MLTSCPCHRLIGQCARCGGSLLSGHICPDQQPEMSEATKQAIRDIAQRAWAQVQENKRERGNL